jgi:hypothetical protein
VIKDIAPSSALLRIYDSNRPTREAMRAALPRCVVRGATRRAAFTGPLSSVPVNATA